MLTHFLKANLTKFYKQVTLAWIAGLTDLNALAGLKKLISRLFFIGLKWTNLLSSQIWLSRLMKSEKQENINCPFCKNA